MAAPRYPPRQDDMTTINDITDLVRILEQQPQWADALRSILLSPALLELPEKFAEFVAATNENFAVVNRRLENLEAGQEELKAGQEELKADVEELKIGYAELKAGQERLENRVNQLSGDVSRLKGTDYEGHAARMARRLVRRHLNVSNARLLSHRRNIEEISAIANDALARGLITDEEAEELELADLIVLGQDENAEPVYVAVEVSVTIQTHDTERAELRAGILARATGVRAIPAAIGTVAAPDLAPSQTPTLILPEPEA